MGHGLFDYELYLPDNWLDSSHQKLLEKNQAPEDLEIKTTELLLEMIHKAIASGNLKAKYIGLDEAVG
jgi:hypothetical protein